MTATALKERTGNMARRPEDPERRCIVTRQSQPRQRLLRFVAGPDHAVVPDLAERLPGRGLWVTARRDIVAQAVAKKAFARAARAPLAAPPDLADQIECLLARRCIDLLSLANRAGLVTAGYEKVRAALRAGKIDLLLTAGDSTGRDAAALRRAAGDRNAAAVLLAAEQGQALGREAFVNVALRAGALTAQLRRELDRLAGFRQTDPHPDADAAGRGDPPGQING